MAKQTFMPEEIETIQLNVIGLLFYVKMHDKRELPPCFRRCEIIIKNIDTCRNGCYSNIEELTQLIKEDWRSAFGAHTGMLEYYIPDEKFEVQKNMNSAISKKISVIGKHINS